MEHTLLCALKSLCYPMLSKNISVINIPIAIRTDCIGGDNSGVRIIIFAWKKLADLGYSPALDDTKQHRNDRNNEQNMNQAAHRVRGNHSEQPKDECDDENSYKHKNSS
jgi:hypothetical protein